MAQLVPQVAKITKIIQETPDVKTFYLCSLDNQKPFDVQPGQLAMLSLPAIGEAAFSITNQGEHHLEMAIKKVGHLTTALHDLKIGQEVGLRGPYGNGFPIDYCRGKDLLFIGGGIGLAPLRSLIFHCLRNKADFGQLILVYGARSKADLCFQKDLFENWVKSSDMKIYLTIDEEEQSWDGQVCFVPTYVEKLELMPQVTIMCGPPIMIKNTMSILEAKGFEDKDIITTLEMRMKCGIGKCGRCNIGSKYVCLDGPVFTMEELKKLPQEY